MIRPYVYENDKGETIERIMRFLVVESTTLEKRKDKKIDASIPSEEKELIKIANSLKKKIYACKKDAQMESICDKGKEKSALPFG